MSCILVAAYGRTYKTRQEAIDDWLKGKDFRILGGPYVSMREQDELLKDFPKAAIRLWGGEYIEVSRIKKDQNCPKKTSTKGDNDEE